MTVTNTVPPAITGSAVAGQQLTTDHGTWTFSLDFLTYAYQWLRCDAGGGSCVAIANAVSPTYVLTGSDVGHAIRSEVTATEHANPTPPTGNVYVSTTGNDTTGNGTSGNPYKTLKKATTVAVSGDVISMAAGTYTETLTSTLPAGVSLLGAGGRNGQTQIKGSMDALIIFQNSSVAVTISGIYLNGQNKGAGLQGMYVRNVQNLTMDDVRIENFKGGYSDALGGAIDFKQITSCEIKNSVFKNSTKIYADWYAGTFGIGSANSCTIHDCTMSDNNGMGIKGNGGTMVDCEFYNLYCMYEGTAGYLVAWPLICFEMFSMDATNCIIRNSYFNRTMSLTPNGSSGALSPGNYRWKVYNNRFDIIKQADTSDNQPSYAMELSQNSCEIHNNYITGGAAAFGDWTGGRTFTGNVAHHNIFDNQDQDYYQILNMAGGGDMQFYKNTYVARNGLVPAIFAPNSGSPHVYDNIFSATTPIGDRLGKTGTTDHNVFYNMTAKGTNATTAPSQPLAISGGFSAAYVPTAPYTAYGALADGAFTVGPP